MPPTDPPRRLLAALLLLGVIVVDYRLALAGLPESVPSFRNDVMAVLSRAGCNMGTCHGNKNGKGGFKLSLRGQSPELDFLRLTRQLGARRSNPLDPPSSLLLRKPAMQIPHEGGKRFDVDSREFRLLRDWIAAGMPAEDDQEEQLVSLTAEPAQLTLYAPDNSVRIRVLATFDNGKQRDVTDLCVFESAALFTRIDDSGQVEFEKPGSTTITARYLDRQVPIRLDQVPLRPDFQSQLPEPRNVVDEAVFAQLKRLKINPTGLCDDSTFIRRAYLDLTGLLPPAEKAREFVKSTQPEKRSRLIDRLLASEEFNDFQALRWSDLLRVEVKTLDEKGVQRFHAWIREAFSAHKPLNQFAAELIAARGSTYEVPPANFYRALRNPEARAEAAAQVFLGVRLQCARCHNHPFDRWTQDDYYGWSNFFARIDYKIVENKRRDKNDKHEFNGEQIVLIKDTGDIKNPDSGQVIPTRFLADAGSSENDQPAAAAQADRLLRLAEWIRLPENERFAATQANRIWYQLMGQGIVDPIDDFRSTNPPSNPELLERLASEFVTSDFNVRHLMRLIMNSATYQFSSVANETNSGNAPHFSRPPLRRLTAEQTLDAITQTLETHAKFGSADPGTRAVQLAGVRNGGHRYSPPEIGDRFLALFGKPDRLQTCECERANDATLAQTFEMVSGELINELLKNSTNRITRHEKSGTDIDAAIADFYWAALSRAPNDEELRAARAHIAGASNRRVAWEDLAWALLNSNEFLLRH